MTHRQGEHADKLYYLMFLGLSRAESCDTLGSNRFENCEMTIGKPWEKQCSKIVI